MTTPNSSGVNIDLAGLTAPITKLIECTSAAIGDVWEPKRIVRKARADAEAAYILAKGQIEIDEMQWQAAQRLAEREIRRQQNRISVAHKAKAVLEESTDPDSGQPMDQDWVTDFFEQVQDISNEQVQNVWAKILAGEVAKPGSYSRRTLETLRLLSAEEAKLFNAFCSFIWMSGDKIMPLMFDERDPVCTSRGMNLAGQLRLKSAGLTEIFVTGQAITIDQFPSVGVWYFGHVYNLVLPHIPFEFQLGKVDLTPVGKELLTVAEPDPSEDIEDYAIAHWEKYGIKVEAL